MEEGEEERNGRGRGRKDIIRGRRSLGGEEKKLEEESDG